MTAGVAAPTVTVQQPLERAVGLAEPGIDRGPRSRAVYFRL